MHSRDLARIGSTLFALVVIAGAVLMVTALVFDFEVLQAVFFGQAIDGGLGIVWERGPMTAGWYTSIVGIFGLVVCGGSWVLLTSLEGADDIYWWGRQQDAIKVLDEQGVEEPTELEIARVVLGLEEADEGWHPATMLRFLTKLEAASSDHGDRVLVQRLKADVRGHQGLIDRSIRAEAGGVDATVKLSGREYAAIDLAGTLDEVLREIRRVEGYAGANPSATPAPVRRR
ncbi:MAG: hypothetical protein ACI8PZ_000184 [Myxococcota bacterium]